MSTSMFTNAQNVVSNGGNFIAAHSIQLNTGCLSDLEGERYAIQTLERNVTLGAFHNSKDRYDAPKCHPRTREAVFREILEWMHVTSIEKPILWLYGPAGAGKSAIAQSVAEKANEMNYLLVGTYFFNRSDGQRNNATHLVPSLAYQMIQSVPCTRQPVLNTILREHGVFSRNFKTQVERLILHPLTSAGVVRHPEDGTSFPLLIIIDGLDECLSSDERTAFLAALIDSCQDPQFPLTILCLSRPESDIRAAFNDPKTSALSARLVLDNKFNPSSDIEAFLIHHFEEIKATHVLRAQIPHDWPSQIIIDNLVRKSSGQFIYASTAMKHIMSRRHNPLKRLETVLSVGSGSDASPFKELDALYQLVLSSSDEDNRGIVGRIIGMICFSHDQPSRLLVQDCATIADRLRSRLYHVRISPTVIDEVLNLEPGTTLLLLDDLYSLIHVRGPTDHLRPFHASLVDFLQDRLRSGTFYVDPGLPPADRLLVYFKSLLNASASSIRGKVEISAQPPARVYFSEASLTVELLDFFENFPWKHVLLNVPRESLSDPMANSISGTNYQKQTPLIWHICELYTFCKMASTKSSVWVAVYQRALRELAACDWVDDAMTLPPGFAVAFIQQNLTPGNTHSQVLHRYMIRLFNLTNVSTQPDSDLFDMVLEVLQTPGLSCTQHINARRHNTVILQAILEGLVLDRFLHRNLPPYHSCNRSVNVVQEKCCYRCREGLTNLIDISDRTSQLDSFLSYIETEVCRPDWVCGKDTPGNSYNSVENLKAAIARYKKKPAPSYYEYYPRWRVDIPSIRAVVAARRGAGETVELSHVLPFKLVIFK